MSALYYRQGFESLSAYHNPYWKNYPDQAEEVEKIKARLWVDGYVAKIIKENNERQAVQ